jgi:hypothetical protein
MSIYIALFCYVSFISLMMFMVYVWLTIFNEACKSNENPHNLKEFNEVITTNRILWNGIQDIEIVRKYVGPVTHCIGGNAVVAVIRYLALIGQIVSLESTYPELREPMIKCAIGDMREHGASQIWTREYWFDDNKEFWSSTCNRGFERRIPVHPLVNYGGYRMEL